MANPHDMDARVAFARRLNQALDANGYPLKGQGRQTAVAKRFDVSQKGARKWLEAESIPEMKRLPAIASVLGVTVEWLLSGQGEAPGLVRAVGAMRELAAGGEKTQQELAHPGKVPEVAWADAAGMSETSEPQPQVLDWIRTTAPIDRRTYALKIQGDAMAPDFPEGHYVIVEPDLPAEDGDFVIAALESDPTHAVLRKLVRDGPDRFLRALNSAYPMRPLAGFKIVGVVRELVRRFR